MYERISLCSGETCRLSGDGQPECVPEDATDGALAPDDAGPVNQDMRMLDDASVAPTCSDEILNQDETDTDCGGMCEPCDFAKACNQGSDCLSGVCVNNACAAPACDDGVQNGTETALDCGGDCAACADGLACNAPGDCASGVCVNNACAAPACDDGVQTAETALDCGGDCAACADGFS